MHCHASQSCLDFPGNTITYRDSTHFSLSWQQKHSPAFRKCSSKQLPHLHLYKNINQLSKEELSILNIDQPIEKLYNSCEINSYELLTKRPVTFDTASILSNLFCNVWFLCLASYTSLPYSAIQLSSANGLSIPR